MSADERSGSGVKGVAMNEQERWYLADSSVSGAQVMTVCPVTAILDSGTDLTTILADVAMELRAKYNKLATVSGSGWRYSSSDRDDVPDASCPAHNLEAGAINLFRLPLCRESLRTSYSISRHERIKLYESAPGKCLLDAGKSHKREFRRGVSSRGNSRSRLRDPAGSTADWTIVTPAGSTCTSLSDTPSVTRSGAAARSFVELSASRGSNFAHLAVTATENMLSELRGLRLYTKVSLADITHHEHKSAVEYPYAATTIPRSSAT